MEKTWASLLTALLYTDAIAVSARHFNAQPGWETYAAVSDQAQRERLKQVYEPTPDPSAAASSAPSDYHSPPFHKNHTQPSSAAGRIPHIFHQVFLDGLPVLEALEREEAALDQPFPKFNRRWRDSCALQHPDWQHMFWDRAASEALLQEHYPWFLPTFQGYPRVVLQGDAMRVVLMHMYGGLYADIDVECFAPAGPTLAGFDVVLQMEDAGPKSLNNAILASRPGLPLWANALRLLEERLADMLNVYNNATATKGDLQRSVLYATGPWLLRDAFNMTFPDAADMAAGYEGEHMEDGYEGAKVTPALRISVNPLGTWFTPCNWADQQCHLRVEQDAAAGTLPPWLVGHHKNAGSWLKVKPEVPAGTLGADAAAGRATTVLRLYVAPVSDAALSIGGMATLGVRPKSSRCEAPDSSIDAKCLASAGQRSPWPTHAIFDVVAAVAAAVLFGWRRAWMSAADCLRSSPSQLATRGSSPWKVVAAE